MTNIEFIKSSSSLFLNILYMGFEIWTFNFLFFHSCLDNRFLLIPFIGLCWFLNLVLIFLLRLIFPEWLLNGILGAHPHEKQGKVYRWCDELSDLFTFILIPFWSLMSYINRMGVLFKRKH